MQLDVSMARMRSGGRLAYVVVPLEGTLEREVCKYDKKNGLVKSMRKEPAGYMVYFPRGHTLRIRTKEDLAHYNLNVEEIPLVDVRGLNDPRSAIGKLLTAQDDKSRKKAMETLEEKTIRLATARTGNVLLPEQVGQGFRLDETPAQASA